MLAKFVAERKQAGGSRIGSAVAATKFTERVRVEMRKVLGARLLYGAERSEFTDLVRAEAQRLADAKRAKALAAGLVVGAAGSAAAKVAEKELERQATANAVDLVYGAPHLLRLLVVVPTLRHAPATAPAATAPTATGGGLGQQPKTEVEHFIEFLAAHATEWLADPAAYVPRGAAAATQQPTPAAAALPSGSAAAAAALPGIKTQQPAAHPVLAPAPAVVPAPASASGASKDDWRSRAMSFLGTA